MNKRDLGRIWISFLLQKKKSFTSQEQVLGVLQIS
jgi:hypothetical protein